MNKHAPHIAYFIYARKSSESEDRQVQSIGDQVDWLKKLAGNLGLHVKEVFLESRSAKNPGERPLFNEMLNRIERGEADGILCWQMNRLFRNPVDSGRVQWLLQRGVIKSIQTSDGERRPEDNTVLFSVEAGVSNQYIIDLRKNVKRGVESKLSKGWQPCLPPAGYLNEASERTIVRDADRFPLIRRMWNLMLTGAHTPRQILEIATNEWGYRTRKTARTGNKELSLSGLYRIFTNPFYYGVIRYGGKLYQGKHEPMITVDEFDRAQAILGRAEKPQAKTRYFPFTGLIRCGECGCMITAEMKIKIAASGTPRIYTYYHCTRRKTGAQCSQRKHLTARGLEEQIERLLAEYQVFPEFAEQALAILDEQDGAEEEERVVIQEARRQTLIETERQLETLTQMRYRNLIEDEEFARERGQLKDSMLRLKQQLESAGSQAQEPSNLARLAFPYAARAKDAFIKSSPRRKREIFVAFGQNPTLKGNKLSIQARSWLQRIQSDYQSAIGESPWLEPPGMGIKPSEKEASASPVPTLSATVEAVRKIFQESEYTYIPDLSNEDEIASKISHPSKANTSETS